MIDSLRRINEGKELQRIIGKFKKLDDDGSMTLEFDEFVKLAEQSPLLMRKTQDELRLTFDAVAGEDQCIDFEEFKDFYKNLLEEQSKKNIDESSKQIPYLGKINELTGLKYGRQWVYFFMNGGDPDYPESCLTKAGSTMESTMMFLIILSTITFCLETLPSLKDEEDFWWICEAIISSIFTWEYVTRLIVCKDKWMFCITMNNVIDLVSFLPFYIELAMKNEDGGGVSVLRVIRTARLTRIIRIAKSDALKSYMEIFTLTTKMASVSFVLLMALFSISTVIMGALCYAAEEDTGAFISMFDALYWAVVTQTTLGYGDIPITSSAGKLLACITVLIGILNLTFAINIIGVCFDEAYARFLTQQEEKMNKALQAEAALLVPKETIMRHTAGDKAEKDGEGSKGGVAGNESPTGDSGTQPKHGIHIEPIKLDIRGHTHLDTASYAVLDKNFGVKQTHGAGGIHSHEGGQSAIPEILQRLAHIQSNQERLERMLKEVQAAQSPRAG